jgi:hypothetical protein
VLTVALPFPVDYVVRVAAFRGNCLGPGTADHGGKGVIENFGLANILILLREK